MTLLPVSSGTTWLLWARMMLALQNPKTFCSINSDLGCIRPDLDLHPVTKVPNINMRQKCPKNFMWKQKILCQMKLHRCFETWHRIYSKLVYILLRNFILYLLPHCTYWQMSLICFSNTKKHLHCIWFEFQQTTHLLTFPFCNFSHICSGPRTEKKEHF